MKQALKNIVAVLAEAGAKPEHMTRMTWYVTDKREYHASAKAIGAAYRKIIGRHFPAMTAVEVKALIDDAAKVEIEGGKEGGIRISYRSPRTGSVRDNPSNREPARRSVCSQYTAIPGSCITAPLRSRCGPGCFLSATPL